MKRRLYFVHIIRVFMVMSILSLYDHLPSFGGLRYNCANCLKIGDATRVQNVKMPYVGRLIGFSFDADYYFGDIETSNKKTQINAKSITADAKIFYNHPLNNHFSVRPALLFGWLKSSDKKRKNNYHKGSFSTIMVEASGGIEYFPFSKVGLYLYIGLAAIYAFTNYDFTSSGRGTGLIHQIAPEAILELGYKFPLANKWSVGFNFSFHQLLLDTKLAGIDGFYPFVKKNNRWNDGFYSVGLNFYYIFNSSWSKHKNND